MSSKEIDRKIAVIFATDVVGYSKHIETDESETIHNLRECEDLLTELFEKHDVSKDIKRRSFEYWRSD